MLVSLFWLYGLRCIVSTQRQSFYFKKVVNSMIVFNLSSKHCVCFSLYCIQEPCTCLAVANCRQCEKESDQVLARAICIW